MIELLSFSILGGLAVSYVTWFLLLDIHSTKGFWTSKTQVVVIPTVVAPTEEQETEAITEVRRAVDMSDYFRRFFRVYHVAASSQDSRLKVWVIRPENSKVWVCPYCLSLWVSFLVSWFAFYQYGVFEGILVHLAISTIASTYIFK